VENGEIWVKGMYIAEYFYGSYNNHNSRRDRKLLLTRREIGKIAKAAEVAGNTVIPLRMFISDKGYAKLVIGIGRGKKQYDKRQSIKEREDKRTLDRLMKK
ncbi:MAG TPA: SsrA-binding protein, partial [Porphyromonadaceae bacterium]|nr:SsrA-binding protein [Porphyromonadaceae bacterium]